MCEDADGALEQKVTTEERREGPGEEGSNLGSMWYLIPLVPVLQPWLPSAQRLSPGLALPLWTPLVLGYREQIIMVSSRTDCGRLHVMGHQLQQARDAFS